MEESRGGDKRRERRGREGRGERNNRSPHLLPWKRRSVSKGAEAILYGALNDL